MKTIITCYDLLPNTETRYLADCLFELPGIPGKLDNFFQTETDATPIELAELLEQWIVPVVPGELTGISWRDLGYFLFEIYLEWKR